MVEQKDYLEKEGIAVIWSQVVANFTTLQQASVLANGIGTLSATVRDHSDSLTILDGRITDVEGYFSEGIANNANMLGGKQLNELFETLSSGTTNAVSIKVGGVTKNISQSTLRTSLGLDTAAYHSHGTYMTEISISGTQLAWKKGDSSQTALTIPYATKALQDTNGLQIDTSYLKLSGGTMNGDLTFAATKRILFTDSSSTTVDCLKYDSGEFRIGYGQRIKDPTCIYGKDVNIRANGANDNAASAYVNLSNSGTVSIKGNTSITGTFGVSGAVMLSSTLSAGATTLASLGVTNNATVGGTLGVTGATTLSSLSVTGNTTVGGTLGVTGNTTLSGTLSVAENISGSKNIQADWGVSAAGVADLSAVFTEEFMNKFSVSTITMSGNNLILNRYTDAPTYQVVDVGSASSVSIKNTLPPGYSEYYAHPRYLRIYNSTNSAKTVTIGWNVVCEYDNVSLPAGSYVEIMFFHPSSSDNWTVKWSPIMQLQ